MSKTHNAGIVTAYGAAVRGGYTGTYEEFCAQQAQYAENARQMEQAVSDVRNIKTSVESAVSVAETHANNANTSATNASNSATQASQSASNANQSAESASQFANNASNSANSASQSATSAQTSANNASTSERNAQQSAEDAQDILDSVQAEGDTQIGRVQAKGNEIIDSLPDDFTEIQNELNALNGSLVDVKADLVEHNAIGLSFPNATSTTKKGITITKVDAHKFHFSSKATEDAFYNLTETTNGAFDGGEKLSDFDSFFVEVSSDVTVNKAMFWVETYIKSTDNANWHWVSNAGGANHWQFRYDKASNVTDVLFRMHWLTGFEPDATFTINIQNRANNLKSFNGQVMQVYAVLANGTDLNDLTGTGIYILSNTNTYTNNPRQGVSSHLICFEYTASNTDDHAKWQMLLPFTGSANNFSDGMYLRSKNTGTSWSNWFELSPATWRTMKSFYTSLGKMTSDSLDLNDLKDNCIVLLTENISYENKPTGLNAGFLMNILTGTWRLQLAWKFSGNNMWKRRGNYAGTTWEEWQEITGITNTYNNTYEFSEYSNTYNVTATPTITTDTNSYLASTGDTTDRTADIVSMLTQTGVCRLGAGDFYVNGLEMPARTMLCGSGNSTRIILSGTADGYAIKMNDYCIVKDLRISGSTGTITPSETLGGRHGILWQGNYTANQNNNDQPNMGIVSNVYIDTFTGGAITCYDTGYGTYCHLEVTNVYCTRCGAGINIAYWSEFHKFTNVRTFDCYYGCINNGGNNVFVNCDFSSCKLAFLMDNSTGQSPNNSHGSAIGCTFNHTNSNTGIGIKILNCYNGFIFSGCQIFFSQLDLDDSEGIVFSNCNFGYSNCDISIDGGKAILFTGNIHQNTPTITITNNADVHFVNCYNRTTGAVVEP